MLLWVFAQKGGVIVRKERVTGKLGSREAVPLSVHFFWFLPLAPPFSQRTHSGLDTGLGDWYCPGSWRKTSWSLGPCLLLSSAPCPTDPLPYFFKPLSLLPSDFVLFMSSPDSAVCVLPEGSDVGRGQKRGNPADITAH